MRSVPRLGLTILLTIGIILGVVIATYTVVYRMIGDEGVHYMRSQE